MNNFIYYTPTKVVFDDNAEALVGKCLLEQKASKILVHYGSQSAVKSGLLDRVLNSIKESGIEFVTLGGVKPNPRLSKVYEGIELCKKENVDFILAIGGGSVIDSAKAIAFGLYYNGDVWDLFEGKASPKGSYPIGCVLTIPAAGSEMSDSCVISKEDGGLKRHTGHESCICKFALMNPKLTLTLPEKQTINGVVDILMHTMERYFNNVDNLDITDRISQGLMMSVIDSAKKLKKDPNDFTARQNIMWAGSLSHNSLTGCGTNGGDWATHNIEHELSGMFDVSHGAGLSTVWASWARYVIDIIPHRLSKYAINVMGVEEKGTEKEIALKGIEKTEEFFSSIGTPISIKELVGEVTDEQIEEMAEKATHFGKILVGTVKPLNKQDIINILNNAR